jgi:hypothetical protein
MRQSHNEKIRDEIPTYELRIQAKSSTDEASTKALISLVPNQTASDTFASVPRAGAAMHTTPWLSHHCILKRHLNASYDSYLKQDPEVLSVSTTAHTLVRASSFVCNAGLSVAMTATRPCRLNIWRMN